MRRILSLLAVAAVLAAAGYAAYAILRTPGAAPQNSAGAGGSGSAVPGGSSSAPGGSGAPASGASPTGVEVPTGAAPAGAAGPSSAQGQGGVTRPTPSPVRFLNIADATLGGHLEHVTSASTERDWGAEGLNDGGTSDIVCTPLCGWASKDATFPQDIVFSFYQGREATVGRVVLDTLTIRTRNIPAGLPKQVEIAVSTSSADDGFTTVATAELPQDAGEQAIDFAPAAARYLRIRLLSNYGGDRVYLDEVGIFEAATAESILTDFPHDLALPALGGVLVSFTSQYPTHEAYQLIDGNPKTDWRSADAYLPQDFVFAFHDDRPALVDHLVLTTTSYLATGPKTVAVSTSLTSPVDGYEEIGQFTLKQQAGDQTLAVGRTARFVKLRILENYGGPIFTSLGEVRVLEGSSSGGASVLFSSPSVTQALVDAAASSVDDPSTPAERERNDTPAAANPLPPGGVVRGRIDPVGEHDFYALPVPGPGRSVVTVDLTGQPNVRTSVTLVDRAGTAVKRFDPSRAMGSRTAFSWMIDPGTYSLDLTEPAASIVLVWDTSGSMAKRVPDLQRAVEAYIDQISPTERVNLVRFSYNIEVLLPEFTSDRARLKAATKGKFFADGATPFYDVMAKAMSMLDGVPGNRAIVVMTDGEDAGSRIHEPEFWQLLQQKNIRLYTIGVGEAARYSARLASSPRRLLTHAALATNGRAFFADQSADLPVFYQQIADELRAVAAYRLEVRRAATMGSINVRATGERIASVAAPSQIELILDASGSMRRAISGRPMIDTAKSVLADIVNGLPDDQQVALRVYGHRVREGRPGACQDSQLVYPFARLNRAQLLSRIRGVRALGTTPIAYSLEQVGHDMAGPGEKMVILVTDGKEECGGDPSAVVSTLQAAGIKLKLNIVGFALADAALKADLRKLAEQTSGQFVEARDAGSLRAAIEQSLAVPYEILDATGAVVAEGTTGQGVVNVPEGVYTVRVKAERPIVVDRVHVAPRQPTTVELRKEGREVGVRVVLGSGR